MWTLTKNNKERLGCFERKILRTIYGAMCENGTWRKRYNHELYGLYKDSHIVKMIKLNRLVGRSCNENGPRRPCKGVDVSKPDGAKTSRKA